MSALAALSALHPKLRLQTGEEGTLASREALSLGVLSLGALRLGAERLDVDAALPEGGLPRGAVVELASARALGGITSLSLRACAAAQADARLRGGDERTEGAFCAFLDPYATLHAPALMAAGVDPTRLLVVRPPLDALARVAVRLAESKVFSVIVIDTAPLPGALMLGASSERRAAAQPVRLDRWQTVVRRLALAVAGQSTTVLLMTDRLAPRSMPLPVAMRLELEQRGANAPGERADREGGLFLRVAKERHGRVGGLVRVGPVRAYPGEPGGLWRERTG